MRNISRRDCEGSDPNNVLPVLAIGKLVERWIHQPIVHNYDAPDRIPAKAVSATVLMAADTAHWVYDLPDAVTNQPYLSFRRVG